MSATPPHRGEDLFALLGLAPTFQLDAAELERSYLERSREVHPDRFASAPAGERVVALQRSMAVNEAYKTLKRPVKRAEYLLGRHGVAIGSNERLDPAFLAEVLELREELAEARQAGDLPKVTRLEKAMKGRHGAAVASLGPLFARVEASGGDERARALADAKTTLILLRYLARYLEECEAALDEDAA